MTLPSLLPTTAVVSYQILAIAGGSGVGFCIAAVLCTWGCKKLLKANKRLQNLQSTLESGLGQQEDVQMTEEDEEAKEEVEENLRVYKFGTMGRGKS